MELANLRMPLSVAQSLKNVTLNTDASRIDGFHTNSGCGGHAGAGMAGSYRSIQIYGGKIGQARLSTTYYRPQSGKVTVDLGQAKDFCEVRSGNRYDRLLTALA